MSEAYPEAKKRLEHAVAQLDQPGLSLDEALKLWQDGRAAHAVCSEYLTAAEAKVAAVMEEGK